MASSLRAGSRRGSTGNRVALLTVTSTHSTPSLLSTVKSKLGGNLKAQGCFPPFALVQSTDCPCKSICVRGGILFHQTLTGGDVSGRLQQAEQVSFSILQGPWPALASLSINMVTWTSTLLLAPPFHTLTTRPFPAPSRACTRLQGTQEDGVPGL